MVVVKEEVAVVQEEKKSEKNGDVVTDIAVVQATTVAPVREPFNVSNTPFRARSSSSFLHNALVEVCALHCCLLRPFPRARISPREFRH